MQQRYTRDIGMEDGEARLDCVHLQDVGCTGALAMLSNLSQREQSRTRTNDAKH